jgi:hypothetical protein
LRRKYGENLKGRDRFGDLGMYEQIILKWFLQVVHLFFKLNQLRIGSTGGDGNFCLSLNWEIS